MVMIYEMRKMWPINIKAAFDYCGIGLWSQMRKENVCNRKAQKENTSGT
jgi:hypothetical protein